MFYFVKLDPSGPEPNNDEKGHLFEGLVRRVVEACGYSRDVNVRPKNASLEFDVAATQTLSGFKLIGEAKAHQKSIAGEVINAFIGKMTPEWLKVPNTLGLFMSTSPLTSEAADWLSHEWYPRAEKLGQLKVVAGEDIFRVLRETCGYLEPKQIRELCRNHTGYEPSETYFVIFEHGYFYAQTLIDPSRGIPSHFCVCDAVGRVIDEPVLFGCLKGSIAPLRDLQPFGMAVPDQSRPLDQPVRGRLQGEGWFDYKFPAPPSHFVGREEERARLGDFVKGVRSKTVRERVIQIKSRSGVGKSSLLLKLADELESAGDTGYVVDARDFRSSLDVLAGYRAFLDKLSLTPPRHPATTTELYAALRDVGKDLEEHDRVAVLFIDQFESLFDRPECYTYVLNLAQEITAGTSNVVVCLARKNDQFTVFDQTLQVDLQNLESISVSVELRDFRKDDINELLAHLRSSLGGILNEELRQQILEHAGGFPWALKRVCRHVLDLHNERCTQEEIARAGLKLEALFNEELEALDELDKEFLYHIVQMLPRSWEELRDTFGPEEWSRLETLQRHYLVRLSGKTFDTYNDVFKEYIRFGRTPISQKWVFKQPPKSTISVLRRVLDLNLDSISKVTERAKIKQGTILNRCRELKLLGLVEYDKDSIRALDVVQVAHREGRLEEFVRQQVKSNGLVKEVVRQLFMKYPLCKADLVRILQEQFPYLDLAADTWRTYAQLLMSWMRQFDLVQCQDDALYPNDVKLPSSSALAADNLQLPRTYVGALFSLMEAFGQDDVVAKKELLRRLKTLKADAVTNDAVFLGLVIVDRDSVHLTPSGKLFSSSSERGRASYVRTQLLKVPFVQAYLAKLASCGTAYHQDIFAHTLREFTRAQWTWSTTDWRAKVLVNWLEFAQLLTRSYGAVSVWRQSVFDFERLGI